MRVISRTELARRNARELAALYAWVSEEIFDAPYGSQERRNGMISLENIRREQARRNRAPQPGGP